ncbi:hypothetical protein KUCAC02_021677, partial [Chaenocephalus aceratus]
PKRKRILNGVVILYAELRRDTFVRSLPSAPPPLLLHSNMALGQQPSKALYSSNHKEAQIRAELDVSQDPGPHSPGSWGQPIISGRQ